ncbi:DnaB-like helicase N-terminal domain-containing protein, partial [Pseudomonas petrae]
MSRDLHSIPAEHGLLGAIFVDPSLMDEIASKVSIEDIYAEENAVLYQAILDCHAAGDLINVVTVCEYREWLPNGDSL